MARHAPRVKDGSARYWGTITALACLALGGVLGWHTGAYLTYFYHLLLVLRPWAGSPQFQNRLACCSLALFVLPLFLLTPDHAANFRGHALRPFFVFL